MVIRASRTVSNSASHPQGALEFRCASCGSAGRSDVLQSVCGRCGGAVIPLLRKVNVRAEELEERPPGVWRYREFLPDVGESVVSLGEGGTPLLRSTRLGERLGARRMTVKDETRNPTGSFVDRGTTVLVSAAASKGVKSVEAFTVGDFGASLAAYCAKAGIEARLAVSPGAEQGKLIQMIAFGARVELLEGRRTKRGRGALLTSGNPYLLEGEKTTAFEIVQDMGWRAPEAIVVPIGSGGHLTAIWMALRELELSGLVEEAGTRIIGVESAFGRRRGRGEGIAELEEPDPPFRASAHRAIRESGGSVISVNRAESVASVGELARTEGIFAEPAAASVVAAAKRAMEEGLLDGRSEFVCVVTGSGLKDTRSIMRLARTPRRSVSSARPFLVPVPIGRTKAALLRSLQGGSKFGYELWKELNEAQSISIPSVYQHLSELEWASFVRRAERRVAGGRERVYYELTAKGREALRLLSKGGKGYVVY
jgi:threonine synthase